MGFLRWFVGYKRYSSLFENPNLYLTKRNTMGLQEKLEELKANGWRIKEPSFWNRNKEYRISPEPRKWFANIGLQRGKIGFLYNSHGEAERYRGIAGETIEVQEILK